MLFVVPAFYAVPYFLTTSAMSAKWLFELEGAEILYVSFTLYDSL